VATRAFVIMCLPCAARQARAFGCTLDIVGLILVLPDYSCAFPALEQFRASYEWQEVPLATTVPAGLEIRLSLDGSHKRVARIPPTWRLMAPLGRGILRLDVTASTRIQEVEVCD